MLSAARVASRSLLETSRQFSSLSLKSGYNPVLANTLAQKYDVRYKSDGKFYHSTICPKRCNHPCSNDANHRILLILKLIVDI